MNPAVSPWLEAVFRWTHVLAGIIWIGATYLFNLVSAQVRQVVAAGKEPFPRSYPALFLGSAGPRPVRGSAASSSSDSSTTGRTISCVAKFAWSPNMD